MEAGDFERACSMLQESNAQDPASGTLLLLGRCFERSGKLSRAWAVYNDSEALARREHQPDREQRAHALSADIELRLPRIRIAIAPSTSSELTVQRNGIEWPAAAWNNPIPVDPGRQVVSVSAPGKKTWSQTFEVSAEASVYIVLVPELETVEDAAPANAAGCPQGVSVAAASETKVSQPANRSKAGGPRKASSPTLQKGSIVPAVIWTLIGVGIGSTASASYFAAKAKVLDSQSQRSCKGDTCSESGLKLRERASSAADAATLLFVVAGGSLATAGVTYLFARDTTPTPTPTVSIAPTWTIGPGVTLVISGRL